MKISTRLTATLLIIIFALSSCRGNQNDHEGPVISDITTSGKVLVISDCSSTSVTITAKVTDASPIISVLLQYRVNSDQSYLSSAMDLKDGLYTVPVTGADLQGNGYGAMEFYVVANDEVGNSSESPVDQSIQFLPCINN